MTGWVWFCGRVGFWFVSKMFPSVPFSPIPLYRMASGCLYLCIISIHSVEYPVSLNNLDLAIPPFRQGWAHMHVGCLPSVIILSAMHGDDFRLPPFCLCLTS